MLTKTSEIPFAHYRQDNEDMPSYVLLFFPDEDQAITRFELIQRLKAIENVEGVFIHHEQKQLTHGFRGGVFAQVLVDVRRYEFWPLDHSWDDAIHIVTIAIPECHPIEVLDCLEAWETELLVA